MGTASDKLRILERETRRHPQFLECGITHEMDSDHGVADSAASTKTRELNGCGDAGIFYDCEPNSDEKYHPQENGEESGLAFGFNDVEIDGSPELKTARKRSEDTAEDRKDEQVVPSAEAVCINEVDRKIPAEHLSDAGEECARVKVWYFNQESKIYETAVVFQAASTEQHPNTDDEREDEDQMRSLRMWASCDDRDIKTENRFVSFQQERRSPLIEEPDDEKKSDDGNELKKSDTDDENGVPIFTEPADGDKENVKGLEKLGDVDRPEEEQKPTQDSDDARATCSPEKQLDVTPALESYDGEAEFSPQSETTPENHYYNNSKFVEPTYDDTAFYGGEATQYWNNGESAMNSQSYMKGMAEQEIEALKNQLLDLHIGMNKTRVAVEFKLKTVLSDLRGDLDYWSETVSGVLASIETKWTMAAAGDSRRLHGMVPPTFLDPNNVAAAAKQHQDMASFHHLNEYPRTVMAPSAPPFDLQCGRMAYPNRMLFAPYGYMVRPNLHQHQPVLLGHNIRGNQFQHPGHLHTHGGIPFMGHGTTHMQPPTMPAGGTPFPNRNKSRSPMSSHSSNDGPPTFSTGTPFPKCNHQVSQPVPMPVVTKSTPSPPMGTNRSGGSATPKKGNSPPGQVKADSNSRTRNPKNAKFTSASKDRPKRNSKNNQQLGDAPATRKRVKQASPSDKEE